MMYKTIEQIHKEFNGEWVFMINCEEGMYGSVAGGVVVLHSENRDVVVRGMENYVHEPSVTYFRYAGQIPEGVSVIL